ncbi:MAG: phosphatidylserine decarboxylase, partial [Clostridia bacterium]|nr:phosphatidylserine decarboxylase [Clostridia bacterium]
YEDYFADLARAGRLAGPGELPAVADASLSVCPIREGLRVAVKETTYSLEELTGGPVSDRYEGGHCLLFRLGLTDYHRYLFPDRGKVLARRDLPGALHTVRPISEEYRVYSRNKRTVTVLDTEQFGELTMIEVGAMLVGHIVDHPLPDDRFEAFTEKGYFEFGGSTIVLLTGPELEIDDRFRSAGAEDNEVHVRMGEPIGRNKH